MVPKPIMVEIVGYRLTRNSFSVQVESVTDGYRRSYDVATSFGYSLHETYEEVLQTAKKNKWRGVKEDSHE